IISRKAPEIRVNAGQAARHQYFRGKQPAHVGYQLISKRNQQINQQLKCENAEAHGEDPYPTVSVQVEDVGDIKTDVRIGNQSAEHFCNRVADGVDQCSEEENKYKAAGPAVSPSGYSQLVFECVSVSDQPSKCNNVK